MLRQHQPVKSGLIAARGRVSQMFLLLVPHNELLFALPSCIPMDQFHPAWSWFLPHLFFKAKEHLRAPVLPQEGLRLETLRHKDQHTGSLMFSASCNFGDKYCFFLCK